MAADSFPPPAKIQPGQSWLCAGAPVTTWRISSGRARCEMETALNRRDVFKFFGVAAFTALQLPAADPTAPLFFSRDEFALLDALTELIIPSDDHSPGAHEAGVAAYIDRTAAEAYLPEDKTS